MPVSLLVPQLTDHSFPIVNFGGQPVFYLIPHPLGFCVALLLQFFHARLYSFPGRPQSHDPAVILAQPGSEHGVAHEVLDDGAFFLLGGVVVEERRRRGHGNAPIIWDIHIGVAVLGDQQVVEMVVERVFVPTCGDALFHNVEQRRSGELFTTSVHENGALGQGSAQVFDSPVQHHIEQRVTRRDEGGIVVGAGGVHVVDVEGDALIVVGHGGGVGASSNVTKQRRHVCDLVATGFPFSNQSAQTFECGNEEGSDESGLEFAFFGVPHGVSHLVEFATAEYVFTEGAFGAEFVKPFGDAGVDDFIEPPPGFWPVTVADCVDKQVFKGTTIKGVGVTEHVE